MSNKSFSEVAADFAESLAALIEHEDCPETIYRAFTDFVTEFENDLTPTWTAQDEAAKIRRALPYLLTRASALEVKK